MKLCHISVCLWLSKTRGRCTLTKAGTSKLLHMLVMLDVFPLQDKLEDLRRLGDTVVQETCKYARESMEHLTIAVTAYICLCVVFYFATVYLKISPDCRHLRTVKRVLFVTAHPDDECMFFGPVILKLAQQSDCQIFILCLSEG